MLLLKKYKLGLFLGLIMLGFYFYNQNLGIKAFSITMDNLTEMLSLVPPIFIFIGLLDVWVPKETLIKYMGEDSGFKGIIISFLLGSAAAGPLYVAFPMAVLLLKKGARLAYIIFFLGVWSSTKLPITLFEIASLGLKFTVIHIGISLPLYLLTAYLIERIIPGKSITIIREKAQSL